MEIDKQENDEGLMQDPNETLENPLNNIPEISPRFIKTKKEVLEQLQKNTATLYDFLSQFFSPEEETVMLTDLEEIEKLLSSFLEFDLSGFALYIQNSTSEETDRMLFNDFYDLLLNFVTPEEAKEILDEKSIGSTSKTKSYIIFTQIIKRNETPLKEIYFLITQGKKNIPKDSVSELIQKMLKQLQCTFTQENIEGDEIIESLSNAIQTREPHKDLDFDSVISGITAYLREHEEISISYLLEIPRQSMRSHKAAQEMYKKSLALCKEKLRIQEAQGKSTQAILQQMKRIEHQLEDSKANRVVPDSEMAPQDLEKSLAERGLQEIHAFYCKQQIMIGNKATFEQLNRLTSHMTIGEFTKFCKDFHIPLPSAKIQELFKKTARLSRDLDWETFQCILQKIANYMIEEEIQALDPNDLTQLEALRALTEEQRLEKLYDFLECKNPAKYRKKLSWMALPFNTKEKNGRISNEDLKSKYRFIPLKNPEEVHRIVQEIRKKREEQKQAKERLLDEKYKRNRKILQRIQEKQNQRRYGVHSSSKPSEQKSQREIQQNASTKDTDVLTWQLLQNLSFKEVTPTESFNPEKLLGEPDEEERAILKKLERNPRSSQPTLEKSKMITPTLEKYGYINYKKPNKLTRSVERIVSRPPNFDKVNNSYIQAIQTLEPVNHKQLPSYHHVNKNKNLKMSVVLNGKYGDLTRKILGRASEIEEKEKKNESIKYQKICSLQDRRLKQGEKVVGRKNL